MHYFALTGLTLLAGYAGLALFAWLFAEALIFPVPPPGYQADERHLRLFPPGGEEIAALYLANPQARWTLLFSHGNGEDLGCLEPELEKYRQAGFAVMAYDYPGYGASEGRPTERGVFQAADAAYNYLTGGKGLDPGSIIAYGRSLGGAPSVDLAARRPLGGLILESAFVSAFRVVTRVKLLPWDMFDNSRKIQQIKCPVLIMQGTRDGIVPFSHGQRLLQLAPEPKTCLWVKGAGHNNLIERAGDRYWQALDNFIRSIDDHVEKPDTTWKPHRRNGH